MSTKYIKGLLSLFSLFLFACTSSDTSGQAEEESIAQHTEALKAALMFAATFDHGASADVFLGDDQLYMAPSYEALDSSTVFEEIDGISIHQSKGKSGNALVFERKMKPVVYFQAARNAGYSSTDWEGTISLWLSLDPEEDLEAGYTDPIQITDAGYNDAALWVDFSDKNPRTFRMGVYGDLAIWNPENISPDEYEPFNERLLTANDRPFSNETWTHVAICFSGLNSGAGKAVFYINGQLQGERDIPEAFSWEEEKAKIFLGLNYVGKMDEISLFDKALGQEEVIGLFQLTAGLKELME